MIVASFLQMLFVSIWIFIYLQTKILTNVY